MGTRCFGAIYTPRGHKCHVAGFVRIRLQQNISVRITRNIRHASIRQPAANSRAECSVDNAVPCSAAIPPKIRIQIDDVTRLHHHRFLRVASSGKQISGRGGGLAGAFGGMGGQSAFGTRAGDMFTRITIVLAVVWVLLAGGLGMMMRRDAEATRTGKDEGGFQQGADADKKNDTEKSLQDSLKSDAATDAKADVKAAADDVAPSETKSSEAADTKKSDAESPDAKTTDTKKTEPSEAEKSAPAEKSDAPVAAEPAKESPADPAPPAEETPAVEPQP